MSLDWSIAEVKDKQQLMDDPHEQSVTDAVVFECMNVDIGHITEKNWLEFYQRSLLFRRLIQAEAELKPSDIRRRIGLRTNVSLKGRAMWLKRIWSEVEWRAKSNIRREDKANAEASGLLATDSRTEAVKSV